MKHMKTRDLRMLDAFCGVTAIAAGILSVLYLFRILSHHWLLNLILALAVLLHVSLSLLYMLKSRHMKMTAAVFMALLYTACLVYFNL